MRTRTHTYTQTRTQTHTHTHTHPQEDEDSEDEDEDDSDVDVKEGEDGEEGGDDNVYEPEIAAKAVARAPQQVTNFKSQLATTRSANWVVYKRCMQLNKTGVEWLR